MNWPWMRFEKFWKLHIKTKTRRELQQMRDMQIAAIHSNPNWDGSENQSNKTDAIMATYRGCVESIKALMADGKKGEGEFDVEEAWETDPLFAHTRRAIAQGQPPMDPKHTRGPEAMEAFG